MIKRDSMTLAAVVSVLGFLLATAVINGRVERKESAPRKAELINLIDDRRSLVNDLDVAVETLRKDVGEAQDRASRDDVRDRAAAREAEALALQAGTVPLKGPGLVVRLSPSDREPPSPEEAGAYQIHDSDLQLTVNALLGAGAEAVAINDSRLVATTPIRAAGSTIVVNFRPLSPPYEIDAIGADRRLFESSDVARRFKRWTALFGLGFSVDEQDGVKVPAYTGRVSITAAEPEVTPPRPASAARSGPGR